MLLPVLVAAIACSPLAWGAASGEKPPISLDEFFSFVEVHGLALSPDGSRVYAPSIFTQDIYVLNAEDLKIIGRIKAPFHVRKLEFSADGKYLYAAAYLGGDVAVYDAASSRRLGSFYVTPRLEGLSATGRYLYAAGAGGLFRIPNDKIISSLSR